MILLRRLPEVVLYLGDMVVVLAIGFWMYNQFIWLSNVETHVLCE